MISTLRSGASTRCWRCGASCWPMADQTPLRRRRCWRRCTVVGWHFQSMASLFRSTSIRTYAASVEPNHHFGCIIDRTHRLTEDILVAQSAITDPVVLRILEGTARIDHSLPSWARRNNPIVRRQLGIYWKTLPLELGMWVKLLLFQAGSVLLAIPFPVLYSLIMPVVTVSVLLLPMVFMLYVQVLYNVTSQ